MAYTARLHQANDRIGLIVMASFFCVLTIVAVVARFYSRRLCRAGLSADDWLALASLVFILALNGIFIAGTVQGAITGHSPIENNWPVTTDLEHLAQKYKYAFQTTEKVAFGLIKLSFVFLWKRIFNRARQVVVFCWVMVGVLIAWFLAFFFATVFQCGTRWTWNWAPIGIFLTQCANTLTLLTVFTATDIVTDFIIMFMPVPMIWKLHMPTKKKIGITSIFMVGLFTIGAGIARMYIYLVTSYDKETNPDFIADFTLFILWSEIEANIAIIVCCMPTLGPVVGNLWGRSYPVLRTIVSRKWTLLSVDRTNTKTSSNSREPFTLELGFRPSGKHSYDDRPWRGVSGTVVTAGSADVEEEQYRNIQGIVARTEISRTSEINTTRPLDSMVE
ncbi:uncharacterized protein F4822DRAFT_367163 [Hypoxylon trugodes]|uniref:uncharacterized protein n=1 Tax=Hypoxylon trugodes TaxID=326681 RepID=UPI00219AFDC5|nr:uncharacterized protein F4822DRAFT_367163 [Hypoxylon trugodes]KAI1384571.1 hypothetical protein F4822DRAFT_367163 [Hypoxylon trugodes]